jgi:sulfonate transport system substrate-binding protein
MSSTGILTRNIVAAAMALGIALTAASASYAQSKPDLSKVTLRIGDQTGATQSKLKAAGLLDDVPYKIEWSVFAAAVNLHEALKADAADTGLAGDAPTVSAIAGGSPIDVIAAFKGNSPGTSIVVPADSPINSVADLRGKTLSPTTRGSAGHFLVLRALKQANVPVSDVKFAFLSPVDANAAFQTKTIDAWAIWGIYRARAQGALKAKTVIDARGITPQLFVLSATKKALADPGKNAALADFSERVARGYVWAANNKEGLIDWYQKFAKLDRDTALSMYEEEGSYTRLPADNALAATLQDIFTTWVEGGVLKGNVDFKTHVYQGFKSGVASR